MTEGPPTEPGTPEPSPKERDTQVDKHAKATAMIPLRLPAEVKAKGTVQFPPALPLPGYSSTM